MHVKKDDKVIVITGDDKNETGKVIEASPKDNTVIVENVNMKKKHQKPRGQGQQGGIFDIEGTIDASNVMIYCEKCKKGVRTGTKIDKDGNKERYCKKCNAVIK